MTIVFRARILRKQDDLPRYIVVAARHLGRRLGAFDAIVTLDDGPPFARKVRPWGKGSDAFFFNLTQEACRRSGVDTGQTVTVRLEPGQ